MILVLNCGSQSIKWKVFDNGLKVSKEGGLTVFNSRKYSDLLGKELKRIKGLGFQVEKIGHRVVHGGEKLREPEVVDRRILKEIQKLGRLAPLHNPYNLLGIKLAQKIFPKASQIAVFDTGFYKDLPERAFVYPLPLEIARKYKIRKFGFHGISHEYAAREAVKKEKKDFRKIRIISCHLGGGSSITAIKNGIAIETSMGFTPLEGLVMMTRCGDIDPGIVLELGKHFPLQKISSLLNEKSGIKGIAGTGNMLELLKMVKKGEKRAKLALDIFVYRIKKYVDSYFAVIGGCDLLVFTGTIGFGSKKIRNKVISGLSFLKNTKIIAIKPDEELAIAQKIAKMKL